MKRTLGRQSAALCHRATYHGYIALSQRQLGLSTILTAYDAEAMAFRPLSVHERSFVPDR